jgi:hypothetical protein
MAKSKPVLLMIGRREIEGYWANRSCHVSLLLAATAHDIFIM